MSTRPGKAIRSSASTTVAPPSPSPRSRIRTSATSVPSNRAPRINVSLIRSDLLGRPVGPLSAQEQVEHGHPYGNAVRDLLDDHRAVGVGDVGADLHSAVHRTGVHHDRMLR